MSNDKKNMQAADYGWYRYHPATFATTTSHLSHVELGVLHRLLDFYWANDNHLPKDVADISERIGDKILGWSRYGVLAPAGFDNEEITAKIVTKLLEQFFWCDDDGDWHYSDLDAKRAAADAEFMNRSAKSKERVKRQSRGSGGQFGNPSNEAQPEPHRELTVSSPCPTVDSTVPHSASTVYKKRNEREDKRLKETRETILEEIKETDPLGDSLEAELFPDGATADNADHQSTGLMPSPPVPLTPSPAVAVPKPTSKQLEHLAELKQQIDWVPYKDTERRAERKKAYDDYFRSLYPSRVCAA